MLGIHVDGILRIQEQQQQLACPQQMHALRSLVPSATLASPDLASSIRSCTQTGHLPNDAMPCQLNLRFNDAYSYLLLLRLTYDSIILTACLFQTAAYGHFGRADPDFTWETPKELKF